MSIVLDLFNARLHWPEGAMVVFEKEGGEFGSFALVVHGMIFTPTRRVTFARENIIIIILSLKVTQQAYMILFCLVCHSSNEILSSAEALLY